jgi:hypothetical protein
MRTLNIGVDLDGVVYNFVDALREWIHESTAKPFDEMPPAQEWNFYRSWGLTGAEFLSLYAAGVNAGRIFRHGVPYPGSVENMRALTRDGHQLHIITSRAIVGAEAAAARNTEHWLHDYDIPHASLTISADKHLTPTDIFLEDSPANYDALEAADRHPWLYTQAWNTFHAGRRVVSWYQFRSIANALATQAS